MIRTDTLSVGNVFEETFVLTIYNNCKNINCNKRFYTHQWREDLAP